MKIKEFKSLREKDIKTLRKLVYDKKLEYMKGKMNIQAGKDKNLKSANNLKREIAKIQTLVSEKAIIAKLEGENK